jgi:predicted transcriptional regulator of viral defense system
MGKLGNIKQMHDTPSPHPDHQCLFEVASTQHGHFTAAQARACGFRTDMLTHHTRRGRFVRVHRGVYRLRDYPSAPQDHLVAAWLALGREAVVSHESALAILDLSDVVPDAIHISVPRARRYAPSLPGVRLHTITRPLAHEDVIERLGIRLTSPARTIVDAAAAGTAPEQVEMAIRQAVRRGLLVPSQLHALAKERGRRVAQLVEGALEQVPA